MKKLPTVRGRHWESKSYKRNFRQTLVASEMNHLETVNDNLLYFSNFKQTPTSALMW